MIPIRVMPICTVERNLPGSLASCSAILAAPMLLDFWMTSATVIWLAACASVMVRLEEIIPDLTFQEAFELTGRHDGEVAFEIAVESAGEVTFTAL